MQKRTIVIVVGQIVLSLGAGIMLEALFGVFTPDEPSLWVRWGIALTGIALLVGAIGLAVYQIIEDRKQEREHSRQSELNLFVIMNQLSRIARNMKRKPEGKAPTPMPPLDTKIKKPKGW